MASGPTEVPLQHCMQRWEQTGGAGSHRAAGQRVLAAITSCWDEFPDWSAAIDGYRLYRRDRGERWRGCPLHQEVD